MSRPLPVAVVRPHRTTRDAAIDIAGGAGNIALRALIAMWLAPIATAGDWRPGYVRCLAVVAVVALLIHGGPSGYLDWTRKPREDER